MNNKPTISLGMPVYNGEAYLEEALDSILAQALTDFELIICDNASTDSTEKICRAYAAKDGRIRYTRNETNIGAAANYNRVFALATAEYFKWVAHDDTIAPDYLEKCLAVLKEKPEVILCYPNTIVIDDAGNPTGDYPGDYLNVTAARPNRRLYTYFKSTHKNRKCHSVFGIVRRDVLAQTGLIGAYANSDFILLAELAMHGQFEQIPDALFFRREHQKTSVNANPDMKKRNAWFDPQRKDAGQFQNWLWLAEYIRAIWRVPMSLPEKLMCHYQMRGWLVKRRRQFLMNELKDYVHQSRRKKRPQSKIQPSQ